ncbi:lipopolysaccharide biosynthesis protein [Thalassotalea fonticola]|uniref:Lipopolysaccharide biosynthesis protein n=1 Tax=Thalassotalea fonticola TaxID=3065649 RepID=A0ABZ0GNM0_9GAMM|nr:lipopolysaccharide biosynthesis protein [Colwelliaceae bacterium S1-1]
MNKQLEELELKFEKFKSSTSEKDWESPDFLRDEAIDIENKDLELAYRLMQRALVLRPNGPLIAKKVDEYKLELIDNKSFLFINEKSEQTKAAKEKKFKILSNKRVNNVIANLPDWSKKSFFIFVSLPWLLFTFYMIVWASPRFESQSQLIVRQPDDMATLDASMAILSGLGMPSANTDTQLVEAYVYSNDMLSYLDDTLNLKEQFEDSSYDFFSRLSPWASREDFLSFYQAHVVIEVDDNSSVITVKVQAFTAELALLLNETIVDRAEWYINSVGHQVAREQLKFVQGEHEIVAKRLEKSKSNLLQYQSEHNLLDPTAEGMAYQQIAYTIEGQISARKAELYALQATMSESSPQIQNLKRVITALEHQLESENSRLVGNDSTTGLTVGEKMAIFTDYKIDLELSLQAFASSLVSLEKSRIEAYRKLQYLVVVEKPTLPDENKYPEAIYNLTLMGVVLLMLYGIGRIIVATIQELN